VAIRVDLEEEEGAVNGGGAEVGGGTKEAAA